VVRVSAAAACLCLRQVDGAAKDRSVRLGLVERCR
jgi:hypothetical protein